MRISNYIEMFEKNLRARNFSERTIYMYINYADIFIRYLNQKGIPKIKGVTRKIVDQYQIDLSSINKYTKKYLSVPTRICRLAAIKSFFKFLARREILDIDPTSHIELPRGTRRKTENYLSYREIVALTKAASGKDALEIRNRAILELLYSSGIRNTELRQITVNDINLKFKTVRVIGKGRKERTVPICEVAKYHIQRYLKKIKTISG